MNRIRLVITDDHQIVRQGLRSVLETEPDIQIIGEAENGMAAVEAASKLSPDLMLLDLMMPGMNGLEALRQIRQRCPDIRTIVLSMHSTEAYVLEALRNGANAYVLKDDPTDTLLLAIRTVMSGRRFLSPSVVGFVVDAYLTSPGSVPGDAYDSLTTREREILQMVAEGQTNASIADRLSISVRTVETHRSNLMDKLKLANQTELVKFAIRRGILSLES